MATIQFTQTVTLCVCVEIPDSQLKAYLTQLEDSNDCEGVEYCENGKPIELTKKSKTEVKFHYDNIEFQSIEKSNGNTYEWDGENLTKEN